VLFEIYGTTLNSPVDLSTLGLTELRKEDINKTSKIINLQFTEVKDLSIGDKYVDNETLVNESYGYYYKKGLCLYEFLEGSIIKVQHLNKISKEILYPLLNYPFAAIFYQRSNLVLHASAVRYQNKTYVFPGITMSGKSSLAAHMIDIGGKLITEDICIISFIKDKPYAVPSYPTIKISDELKDCFEISKSKKAIFHQKKNNRRVYKLHSKRFISKMSKIDFIIFPEWSKNNDELKEIHKPKSLKKILESSFFSYVDFNQKDFFKKNLSLSENTRCFNLKRRKNFSSFNLLNQPII